MSPRRSQTFQRAVAVFVAILAAVAAAPLLLPSGDGLVFARRYPAKKCYGKGLRYLSRCNRGCVKKGAAIRACATRKGMRRDSATCRKTYQDDVTACGGEQGCTSEAKSAYKSCLKEARRSAQKDIRIANATGYGGKRCSSCCRRTCGQGNCNGYFGNARWYGSYRYRRYGRTRLICVDGKQDQSGSPSQAFVPGFTDAVRDRVARLIPFLTEGWTSE